MQYPHKFLHQAFAAAVACAVAHETLIVARRACGQSRLQRERAADTGGAHPIWPRKEEQLQLLDAAIRDIDVDREEERNNPARTGLEGTATRGARESIEERGKVAFIVVLSRISGRQFDSTGVEVNCVVPPSFILLQVLGSDIG